MIIKNNWDDISVEEWVILEDIKTQGLSFFEYQLMRLSILCENDVDDDIWSEVDLDDLNILLKSCKFLDRLPTNNFKKVVGDFILIDIKKITIGEWIDLDTYLSDITQNFNKILSILYRRYKVDDWGNHILEPYNFDINKRCYEFDDLPITYVYGVIDYINDFRESIFKNYNSELSIDDGDELSDEEKDGLSDNEILEIENDLKLEKAKKDFSWMKYVYDLADGDITKIDSVLKTSFVFSLNIQVMLKVYK